MAHDRMGETTMNVFDVEKMFVRVRTVRYMVLWAVVVGLTEGLGLGIVIGFLLWGR